MKTFAISIPKPCHEDWNKMTPDAKGAFCGSCQKSVYDFSKKSDEEIIAVFEKEEKGKVCGRFTPSQLSRPVVSFGEMNSTSRLTKFLYALLLVFGSTLFIGGDAFGQNVKGEVKMGKMTMRPIVTKSEIEEIPAIKDTVIEEKIETRIKCGLSVRGKRDLELMQLVQIMVIETPPPTIVEEQINIKTGEVVFEEPIMLSGDTIFTELPIQEGIDTIAVENHLIIDTVELIEPDPMLYIAGGISYIEVIESEPLQIVETPVDTTEITNVPETTLTPIEDTTEDKLSKVIEAVILPTELEVRVSPNPSSGQITLTYTLESAMAVKIELFDITGKMVKTLSNEGKQYAGKYNVSYNISDLPNGIYMATLTTDGNKVSAKVILTK